MKLRNTARKFKTWIKRLWEPRYDFETASWDATDSWLADLEQSRRELREDRIRVLIDEISRLRAAKKRHSHLQTELNGLRAEQLGRGV